MVRVSQSIIIDCLEEPIAPGDNTVDFRLLYTGQLLGASRSETRASHKHEIRRSFHPQLRRLWESNENLKGYAQMLGFEEEHDRVVKEDDHDNFQENEGVLEHNGREILARRWGRGSYRCVPLVTAELALRCNLEILFLRPEEPGQIINSGDIDNRVKTLFDALRIPSNTQETGGMEAQPDENPFYCLLEDDRLISEVSITTDQLLLLPGERKISPNHAFVVISLKLKPNVFSMKGLRFI